MHILAFSYLAVLLMACGANEIDQPASTVSSYQASLETTKAADGKPTVNCNTITVMKKPDPASKCTDTFCECCGDGYYCDGTSYDLVYVKKVCHACGPFGWFNCCDCTVTSRQYCNNGCQHSSCGNDDFCK